MNPLTAKRRSELRGEAHKLSPIVIIGDKGLTDEVVAEIDRSLRAHELIKVRAASGERDVRETWLDTICTRLDAHAVQMIGKVFVIYRENPEEKLGPGPSPRRGARGDEGSADARGGEGKQRRESSATAKARVVSEQARAKQRARDDKKRRERDARDMARKGKLGPVPASAMADERGDVKRTSRPRSRTPSPLPESEPRRRRPRTFR
jgi:putative YhbY family RNA-binding protein